MSLKINSDMLTAASETIAPFLLPPSAYTIMHWHVTEQIERHTRIYQLLTKIQFFPIMSW
jgi:hypothetical protein